MLLITVWVYYFFRDPDRVIINDNSYLVSPADGLVTDISEINGPEELGLENNKYTRISIFMNVFNCHVNRTPIEGKVEEIFYKPGKFFNASLDKASKENERNYYKILSTKGEEIIIVQIAGLIARRIICEVSKDQNLKQGDRIGMIRFGSRVDIFFKNKKILTKIRTKCCCWRKFISKRIMEEKKFKIVESKKTRYILPNILTIAGVCLGISSIKFSLRP